MVFTMHLCCLVIVSIIANSLTLGFHSSHFQQISNNVTADVLELKTGIKSVVECSLFCLETSTCALISYDESKLDCTLKTNSSSQLYTPYSSQDEKTVSYARMEYVAVQSNGCPFEWQEMLGKCYFHSNRSTLFNFTDAMAFCQSFGSTMAVLSTQVEFETVIGYYNDSAVHTKGTWMDGVYTTSWSWNDGEPWTFDYFLSGISFTSGEVPVVLGTGVSTKRKWRGSGTDYLKHALCEMDLP